MKQDGSGLDVHDSMIGLGNRMPVNLKPKVYTVAWSGDPLVVLAV